MIDDETIRSVMRELGSRGGKKGGKARMGNLTPQEKTELGRKAGLKSAEARAKNAKNLTTKKAAAKKAAAKKASAKTKIAGK